MGIECPPREAWDRYEAACQRLNELASLAPDAGSRLVLTERAGPRMVPDSALALLGAYVTARFPLVLGEAVAAARRERAEAGVALVKAIQECAAW